MGLARAQGRIRDLERDTAEHLKIINGLEQEAFDRATAAIQKDDAHSLLTRPSRNAPEVSSFKRLQRQIDHDIRQFRIAGYLRRQHRHRALGRGDLGICAGLHGCIRSVPDAGC